MRSKLCRDVEIERRRDLLEHDNGRIAPAPLDAAQIGPVQPCAQCDLFLAGAFHVAQGTKSRTDEWRDVHLPTLVGCRLSVHGLYVTSAPNPGAAT